MTSLRFVLLPLLVLLLNVPYSRAQTIDPALTEAAQCNGILKGNVVADFVLGSADADRMEEVFLVANAYLMANYKRKSEALGDGRLATYEKLSADSLDYIVAKVDNNAFDSEVYEQILGCYHALSRYFLMHGVGDVDKTVVESATRNQVENVKILLSRR
jgi:hypothetical protein